MVTEEEEEEITLLGYLISSARFEKRITVNSSRKYTEMWRKYEINLAKILKIGLLLITEKIAVKDWFRFLFSKWMRYYC